jgi:hypothetical protein
VFILLLFVSSSLFIHWPAGFLRIFFSESSDLGDIMEVLEKDEIADALIKAMESKSPQVKLLRKYFDLIEASMEAGLGMDEVLKIISSKSGVTIKRGYAYQVLSYERKKRKTQAKSKPASAKSASPVKSAHPPQLVTAEVAAPSAQDLVAEEASSTDPASHVVEKKISTSYRDMPIEDLPQELRAMATAEIGGEIIDVRMPSPPARFGSASDQVMFGERMKSLGLEQGDAEWDSGLATIQQNRKHRKSYEEAHRAFARAAMTD